jgi:hypothetical protein
MQRQPVRGNFLAGIVTLISLYSLALLHVRFFRLHATT